jgi:hypothetical protein
MEALSFHRYLCNNIGKSAAKWKNSENFLTISLEKLCKEKAPPFEFLIKVKHCLNSPNLNDLCA